MWKRLTRTKAELLNTIKKAKQNMSQIPTPPTHLSGVAPRMAAEPSDMQYADNQPIAPQMGIPAILVSADRSGDSVQALLATELSIGFVPKNAFTVDAIRIIRYVQLRGAVDAACKDFSQMTLDCIQEVAAKCGWDIRRPDTAVLRIVDYADFVIKD